MNDSGCTCWGLERDLEGEGAHRPRGGACRSDGCWLGESGSSADGDGLHLYSLNRTDRRRELVRVLPGKPWGAQSKECARTVN